MTLTIIWKSVAILHCVKPRDLLCFRVVSERLKRTDQMSWTLWNFRLQILAEAAITQRDYLRAEPLALGPKAA